MQGEQGVRLGDTVINRSRVRLLAAALPGSVFPKPIQPQNQTNFVAC